MKIRKPNHNHIRNLISKPNDNPNIMLNSSQSLTKVLMVPVESYP